MRGRSFRPNESDESIRRTVEIHFLIRGRLIAFGFLALHNAVLRLERVAAIVVPMHREDDIQSVKPFILRVRA